jgi:hypothetical protein
VNKIGLAQKVTERVYPGIKKDLYISGMDISVERFFWLSMAISFVIALIFATPIALILAMLKRDLLSLVFIIPCLFILFFFIVLRIPSFNVESLGKRTEAEIAVTGRRLLIQLESGKSLVNSLLDMSKGKSSSKALERLSYELYMGKPLEIAIKEAIANSPSPSFRKLFIQIHNSLRTGSDLKHTVKATLEEITRKKIIEFEEFGKKLSPLGLFYMIFGTIAPSLGIVVFVMLLTFLRIPIRFSTLSLFLVIVIFTQLMFIGIFSRMRPELEL